MAVHQPKLAGLVHDVACSAGNGGFAAPHPVSQLSSSWLPAMHGPKRPLALPAPALPTPYCAQEVAPGRRKYDLKRWKLQPAASLTPRSRLPALTPSCTATFGNLLPAHAQLLCKAPKPRPILPYTWRTTWPSYCLMHHKQQQQPLLTDAAPELPLAGRRPLPAGAGRHGAAKSAPAPSSG